jgi:hypothetical protein
LLRCELGTWSRRLTTYGVRGRVRRRAVSVVDFGEAGEEDWLADAGGADTLSEEAFKMCWFQLADVHTETISADDYAECVTTAHTLPARPLRGVRSAHSSRGTMCTGRWVVTVTAETTSNGLWRTDREMLEGIREMSGASSKTFGRRASKWCELYEPESHEAFMTKEERCATRRASNTAGSGVRGGGMRAAPLHRSRGACVVRASGRADDAAR